MSNARDPAILDDLVRHPDEIVHNALKRPVDFDLHGLIGVRLIDPAPRDVAAHVGQLGPPGPPLDREPDLTIRFVDRLRTGSLLHHLGPGQAGYDDEGFVLVRRRDRGDVRMLVPFDRIGRPCEIVTEHGAGPLPFLNHILNLIAVDKETLALHGTSFRMPSGRGVVATGWSKGGKTETLLVFAAHGATYVGDEWLLIDPDGSRVRGIPQPIRVWDWHLRDLPATRRRIGARGQARLVATRWATAAADQLADRAGASSGRALDRVARVIDRRRHVELTPTALFGPPIGSLSGPFDRLFLMTAAAVVTTTVSRVDPREVADRMAASLQHERLELLVCYHQFRYAFPAPERANPVLEGAPDRERRLLRQAFAGKETFEVTHPHPMSLLDLHEAMAPYC